MNRWKALCAVVVTAGLAAVPAVAFADTPSTGGPDAIAAVVNQAAPGGGPQLDVSKSDANYVGSTSTSVIAISDTAGSAVSVTSTTSQRSLVVDIPAVTGGATAAPAKDGTLTYDNAASPSAVAVQPFEQGVRISTILKDTAAPTEYSYPVDVPSGGSITSDSATGAVVVTSSDGKLIGGFAPAWAKDATGSAVPTHYEVRGTVVVQVVDTHAGGFAYPIVADPYLGIDLIDHASWVHYSDGWTLQVYPTPWARAQAGSYLVGTFDWDELYTKYSNRGLNTNLNGMRDQLICHQQFVAVRNPGKVSWNIDEWRPDVGYAQTVNASCNPGGPRWFD